MSRKQTLCYPEDCSNKSCKKLNNTYIRPSDEEETKDNDNTLYTSRGPANVTKGTQLKISYLVNKSTVEKSTSVNQTLQENHEAYKNSKDARKLEGDLSLFSLQSTSSQDHIRCTDAKDIMNEGFIDDNEPISIEEKCSSSCTQIKQRAKIDKKFKNLKNFSKKLSLRKNKVSINDLKVEKPQTCKSIIQSTCTSDHMNKINETLTEPRESRNVSRLSYRDVQREGLTGRKKLEISYYHDESASQSGKHIQSDVNNAPSGCTNHEGIHSKNTGPFSEGLISLRKPTKNTFKDKSKLSELAQSRERIKPRVNENNTMGLTYQDIIDDVDLSNNLISKISERRLPKQSKATRSLTEDTASALQSSKPENRCVANSCKSFHLEGEREELLSVVSLSSDDSTDQIFQNPEDNLISIRRTENLLIRIEIDLKKLCDFLGTACFRIFLGPSLDETAFLSWEFTDHILRRRSNDEPELNYTNL